MSVFFLPWLVFTMCLATDNFRLFFKAIRASPVYSLIQVATNLFVYFTQTWSHFRHFDFVDPSLLFFLQAAVLGTKFFVLASASCLRDINTKLSYSLIFHHHTLPLSRCNGICFCPLGFLATRLDAFIPSSSVASLFASFFILAVLKMYRFFFPKYFSLSGTVYM